MNPEAFKRNLRDAELIKAITLPAAASTTTVSAGIDVAGPDGVPPEMMELLLEVPALSTTIAPDTRTVTYIIEVSNSASFTGTPLPIASLTQTGAGGAGVGAVALRARPPAGYRYARGKVTFGASTTDGSAVTGSAFSALF